LVRLADRAVDLLTLRGVRVDVKREPSLARPDSAVFSLPRKTLARVIADAEREADREAKRGADRAATSLTPR
jgi:hypothetical protein